VFIQIFFAQVTLFGSSVCNRVLSFSFLHLFALKTGPI
jgi:hypothetical protein